MPRRPTRITFDKTDLSRVPDAFTESVALLLFLERTGLVAELGRRLRIRREGGYPGVDIALLLLVYFASGVKTGIRKAWEQLAPLSVAMAGLAGRKKLPSPAALSRGLSVVEPELVRPATAWLLGEFSGVDAVMKHPATATYDSCGDAWHLFDLDPTVTTLRHRALPVGEDLPEARRRSESTGRPGYPGRKRGDVQHRRVAVQHAGSAVWVHSHLSLGNGEGLADLGLALDAVVATVERLGVPREQTLVRTDGEYGHVPGLSACRERSLPVLMRLNRASLLDDVDILQRLRNGTWERVPDSGSGPKRLAMDLGTITLHPGAKTRRPDGSRYEPVKVRVVASVYRETTGRGRGRVLDGWRVELFIADLPTGAWPAADCVAVYFARAAEENRFAQEDRELGLDRIFSYHLPGQELAHCLGLAIWNIRIVQGYEMERPPQACPVRQLRPTSAPDDIELPPAHWPRDPVLLKLLAALDWPELLASRAGWRWSPEDLALLCPQGREVALSGVREGASDARRLGVVFRRPAGGCERCGARDGCFHSQRPRASKHLELPLDAETARALNSRLSDTRRSRAEPDTSEFGSAHVALPRFLPAEARAVHRRRFLHATIHIELTQANRRGHLRLVADSDADRQSRRKTWKQRVDDYAVDPATRLDVTVLGSHDLRAFIEGPAAAPRRAATSLNSP